MKTLLALCLLLPFQPAQAAERLDYVILRQGTQAGHKTLVKGDDGVYRSDFTYKDNGRGPELKEEFTGYGVDAFVYLVNHDQANDPAMVRQLDSATGIWFGGGDQFHLTDALGGTASLRAIQARYRAGAVVGGTSAGAAIMSDSMITGNQTPPGDTTGYYGDEFPAIASGRIQVIPGLGFLPGAVVDQHFIKRERHNRLLSAILERPSLVGVGIDESTAIEVAPDGHWTVLGLSEVIVYDGRKAHISRLSGGMFGVTDLRMHILTPGSTYNPNSCKVTLSSR